MGEPRPYIALAVVFLLTAPFATLSSRAALAQQVVRSGIFHGVGVVIAIDATTGALTIDHDEIKGFMAAMEMMYRVDPATLSAGLHVGDHVAFAIDGANETIVGVTALGPAK